MHQIHGVRQAKSWFQTHEGEALTDLYDWTGVEMLEVHIMRRTLSCLSSLAKYDNDRWEVQMLGAEFEARSGDKRAGRKLT